MPYICNGGVVNCVSCQSGNGTCGKGTTVMLRTSLSSFSLATISPGTSMQDQYRKRADEAAEKMQLVNQQIADTAERQNELKARQKEAQDEEEEHRKQMQKQRREEVERRRKQVREAEDAKADHERRIGEMDRQAEEEEMAARGRERDLEVERRRIEEMDGRLRIFLFSLLWLVDWL
jgi:ABC-type dipeptide/oligopeptide/nickel transport system ATPase subunit